MLLMLVGKQAQPGKVRGVLVLPGGMGLTAQLGAVWPWQGSQVCWPRLTAPWEPEGAHMGNLVSEPPGPESLKAHDFQCLSCRRHMIFTE